MGNSIRRVGLLSTVRAGEDEPFHYKLGRKISIDLSERKFTVDSSGGWTEQWTMSYSVDVSTSTLTLTRSGKGEGAKGLRIKLSGVIPAETGNFVEHGLDMVVQTVTESDATVRRTSYNVNCPTAAVDRSEQFHEEGRVTETKFYFFGSGDAGSLTVLEMKKKKIGERRCYAVTLAHYFASINDFSRNKTDVGLSIVVKIRVSKGNLEVTVQGPEQHPAFGLRYLFDEVMRTKIWKPTLCPHCATIQKQPSTKISQSDSDDSKSVPVARRHGGSQENLRVVDNGGKFNGNDVRFFGSRCWKTLFLSLIQVD
ncbi:uncharacterized protein LOC108343972 [Vigna angularis]|uniref:uncharacterized protein LOC108343972 n=1 Tax=Phaseolus angularis TaxID=3914 RepID=UPI00080A70EA|nr:uncharacterized protein LOC108343972 [Vigna angularis]